MIIELLKQNFKRIQRVPGFQGRMIGNIILSIITFILLAFIFYFSINIAPYFRMMGKRSPILVMNQILFLWFPFSYLLRFSFQRYGTATVKPYLILNVGKEKIVDLILLVTSINLLNFLPFIIFAPFAINGILPEYPWYAALAWFLTILSAGFFNSYLANYSRMRFRKNPVITVVINIIGLALIFSTAFLLPADPLLWSKLMYSILYNPFLCFIPIIGAVLLYYINYKYLLSNIFIEDPGSGNRRNKTREKELKESFSFLYSLGKIGHFILLDLKLLLRNSRTKSILFSPLFMVFYGFVLFHNGTGKEVSDLTILFACNFMIGAFTVSYGINVFAWESSYFSLIMTTKIDMKTYIRSKYYFIVFMAALLFFLTSFYFLFFGTKILLIQTVVFFFNIGIAPFAAISIALSNKTMHKLNGEVYSRHGGNKYIIIGSLCIHLSLFLLYFGFKALFDAKGAVICIGLLALAGVISYKKILSLIEQAFYNKKYIMIEGFKNN